MPKTMTLEGPRLRLRPWREEDRAALAAINTDPEAMRHFAAPMTRAESDAWMDRLQAHVTGHGWGFWCVERRETPGCIGAVGLMPVRFAAPFAPAVEIGWRIAPAQQRQGFAEEAARLALAAGFGPLGLAEIVAFTRAMNEPSWRLMQRLGMVRGEDFEHPGLPEGHPARAHILYRLTRAAWVAQRFGGGCGCGGH
ncbi:GNAT family N-acetyltransferase [Roseicella aquatilis]|uniref:N-acetyltransferase n=1 Tax=Roseicella aquatilis TaxID=2527868 RepID=A0A4R4DWM9_9PROT|nr:GNAT family protein [Roseicella aquatilis]TCZ65911.1 N-acetyltransferase [Roseicella aquatilis]